MEITYSIGEENSMNKEEIERCLTAYGEDIYRFCCFLTRSRDLADDLYQESFMKAMEVERFVDESVMKNFVIGIAANIWKNTWRKEKRRRKVVSTTEFDAEYMYEPAFGDTEQNGDPQDTYIREETRQIVIRAVDTLPDRYRIILLMYYSADMTTQEIADQLGMSKGTVTSRLMRARDKVRRNLEDNGYER